MAKSGRYGTAFEALEDEDGPIKKRPKRIHEEVVTDERGRRRFHGAFTGGFSAGYFNTVGSKHGWVPQTFKSSKNHRAEVNQARPEDFMDEEDLGEFGFASREFHVNKKYTGSRQQPEGMAVWDRPSTVGSALDDLFKISEKQISDSIGMKMMKKMGYRAGKGIGAPMTKRQLEIQRINEERARGKRTRFDKSAIEEAEEFAKGFEFIPEDIPPVYFSCKENDHGLGYQPLKGLTGGYQSVPQVERTKRGDAFGVGVFEDSDDDIYGNEDMSKYNFELGKVDIDPMAQRSTKSDVYDTVFVPAKKPRKRPPHLTIVVPTNFNPRHKPIPFDPSNLPSNIREYGKKMTVMERSMILGETKVSALNLLSFEDREKLRQARRIAEEQEKKPKKDVRKEYEAADPFIVKSVEKSNRFQKYLECLKRGVAFNKPADLSANEWQIEEQEFQKAVPQELRYLLPEIRERKEPLYKGEFAQTLMQKLKSKFVTKEELEVKTEEKPQKKLEPFIKTEWHPAKRLCKRMNVPDPFPSSLLEGIPGALPKTKPTKEFTVTELENQLQTRGPKPVTIEEDEDVKPIVEPKEPEPLFAFFALMNEVFGTSEKEVKEGEKLEETAKKDAKRKEKERDEKIRTESERKEKEKPAEERKYRSLLDKVSKPKEEPEIIEEVKKEVVIDVESDSSSDRSSRKKKKKKKHKKEEKEHKRRHKKHKKKKHKKESSKKHKKSRRRSSSSESSSSSVVDVY